MNLVSHSLFGVLLQAAAVDAGHSGEEDVGRQRRRSLAGPCACVGLCTNRRHGCHDRLETCVSGVVLYELVAAYRRRARDHVVQGGMTPTPPERHRQQHEEQQNGSTAAQDELHAVPFMPGLLPSDS